MSFAESDRLMLRAVLKVAREIELDWPAGDRRDVRDLSGDRRYQNLKNLIHACAGATEPDIKRLTASAVHLSDRLTLAHFYGILVPFERLEGRGLRDDEFLVLEGDGLREVRRVPVKIIAENLRSSFNVGAIFRTAECLGASEILLCGYTPGPDDEKTARTAMGAADYVPWRRVDRAPAACEELRREGYRIVALETAASATSLHEFKFDGRPVAFVLGNERFGIEAPTLAAADDICRIPVNGVKNSLNVGIAFGIVAFEWLRQHGDAKSGGGG